MRHSNTWKWLAILFAVAGVLQLISAGLKIYIIAKGGAA